jgi:phosphoglycerate-specific signal transduction histidine kinase
MVSPEESERHYSQHWDGLEEACNKLIHSMAEPLTAIGNYVEAARVLSRSDAAAVHAQIDEVLKKAQNEVDRANRVLNEMRQLLQKKKP